MKKKYGCLALVICIMCNLLAGCGGSQSSGDSADKGNPTAATYNMKVNSCWPATHPWSRCLDFFKENIEKRTDGQISVNVYYSDSIGGGNSNTAIEMVCSGAATMDIRSPLAYTGWNEKYSVFCLPFLFDSHEQGFAAMESEIGQEAMTWMSEQGCTGVGLCLNGYRQLTNSKHPVTSPADLKDLKLRIPTAPILVDVYQTLGAEVTSMTITEVYTSIQNGAIDGQENPVSAISSNKFYEVCPYITLWSYLWDPAFVMCNTAFLESLTPELREIFDECIDEMCQYSIDLTFEEEAAQIQAFKDYGCEVVELTAEQNAAFKEAAAPVYEHARASLGDELVDAILQAAEAAK